MAQQINSSSIETYNNALKEFDDEIQKIQMHLNFVVREKENYMKNFQQTCNHLFVQKMSWMRKCKYCNYCVVDCN